MFDCLRAVDYSRLVYGGTLVLMVGASIGFIVITTETAITGFSASSASQYETREETNHQLVIWVVVTTAVALLSGLYGVFFRDRGWTMASMVAQFVLLGIVHVLWNDVYMRIAAGISAFFTLASLVCGNIYEEGLSDDTEKYGACCGGGWFDLPDQDYQSLRRLAWTPLLATVVIAVVVIGMGSSLRGTASSGVTTELWSLRFTLVIAAVFSTFGALLALRALMLPGAGSRLMLYSAFTWCVLGMMFASSVVFQLGAANDVFQSICRLPASVRPSDCQTQRRLVTALYAFVFPLIVFAGGAAYLALRLGEKLQSENTRLDHGLSTNVLLRLSLRQLAARGVVAAVVVQAGCAIGLLAIASSQGNGSGFGNSAGGVEFLLSQFNYTVCFIALGTVLVGLTALLLESRAALLLYVALSLYTGMCAQIVCKRGGVQLLVGGLTSTIKTQAQNSVAYTAVLFGTAAMAAAAALVFSESLQDDSKASSAESLETASGSGAGSEDEDDEVESASESVSS